MELSYYKDKSIFVTGHTGFKGAWLCHVLKSAGAAVSGYALPPEGGSVFELAGVEEGISSTIGDVRDMGGLAAAFERAAPEIVFHMAAQPLVLDSYSRPVYTFETNVMGTVNLLECVRRSETVKSVVVVTTDKVYKNNEWPYGYRETDPLGGSDPYAASKSCAEIVSDSYRSSFLQNLPFSTARAGNVIGGGDISENRIIPDCVRAAERGEPVIIRNPHSVRPYQHVLEPLFAYLMIAARQFENPELAGAYNIGPGDADCVTTGALVEAFCEAWGSGQAWVNASGQNAAPHESGLLRLDCSKIRSVFDWNPVWDVCEAIAKTVQWEKARIAGGDLRAVMDSQIDEYVRRCV